MSSSLVVSVRLHEGWYHGAGSIPSPARLFQALIAGQGLKGPLNEETVGALEWLEQQPPPIVAAPLTKAGQAVATFVPNNDLDSRQGDHRRVGEIRTKKTIHPLLFDEQVPFVFCWELTDADVESEAVRQIIEFTNGIFQLGRAVDSGWAWAEVMPETELDELLRCHRGPVHSPSFGAGSVECPTPGSLRSLVIRHDDLSRRYAMTSDGKGQTFRRRAKPKWTLVSYENAATRICFDLLDREDSTLVAWPLTRPADLVTLLRDAAVAKLVQELPDRETEINRTLVGRKPDGENAGPITARVRIIPLPSIGHEHTDPGIRRVLIEIPGNCPLRSDDIAWAFSGQQLTCHGRGAVLVRTQRNRQLEFYGIDEKPSCHWETVTPVALTSAARRRVESDRTKRTPEDQKAANERCYEQELAASAIGQALRHSGVRSGVRSIRLQREPFTGRGQKSEDFASQPRFSKHALWHVSLELNQPVAGPLLIGDGRFLGLGLMKPVSPPAGVISFKVVSGLNSKACSLQVADAFRRAIMACARDETGSSNLHPFFSGHYRDGSPTRSEDRPHLAVACDLESSRLFVIPPSVLSRVETTGEPRLLKQLAASLQRLHIVRAGQNGTLAVQSVTVDETSDPLFTASRTWSTVTPYTVNRHAKKTTAEVVIARDVIMECERRGLPRPEVNVISWTAGRGTGLQAQLTLQFMNHVSGPLLLGKHRHKGGGLFRGFNNTPEQ